MTSSSWRVPALVDCSDEELMTLLPKHREIVLLEIRRRIYERNQRREARS